ncbi:hypothetical protein BU17DRAFT_67956 [Hysterangium stoloniferum]|nr:hypothetical protein BU17DRAFT_67956 [Hysterangium stoloniferum]
MIYSAIHTPPNGIFLATSYPALLSQTILQLIEEFRSRDDDLLEMRAIMQSGLRKQENLHSSLKSTLSGNLDPPESAAGVTPLINFNIFMGLDADDQEGSASCTVRRLLKIATTPSMSSESSGSTPRSSVKTAAAFVEDQRSDDTAPFTSRATGALQAALGRLIRRRWEVFNNDNEPARLVGWKSRRVETDDEEEQTKESIWGVRRSKKPKHEPGRTCFGLSNKPEHDCVRLLRRTAHVFVLPYHIHAQT